MQDKQPVHIHLPHRFIRNAIMLTAVSVSAALINYNILTQNNQTKILQQDYNIMLKKLESIHLPKN